MAAERELTSRSPRDPICHVEIHARDAARARAFYAAAFGWSFARTSPDYEWIDTGAPVSAGLVQVGAGRPPGVTAFIAVRDVAASIAAVVHAGGRVVREPRDVPGHGRYALIADPDGNQLGVWQRPE